MYKKSSESYRHLIKEQNLPLNKKVTKDSQWKILQSLKDDCDRTSKSDNIIFDRGTLDNIIYSLWGLTKGSSDIDEDFINKCIPVIKDSMRNIDIIFFLPITKVAPVKLIQREGREIDPEYVSEIDNLFKAVVYQHNRSMSPFFHKDDCPPIIEIFGNPIERIELLKLYINKYGDAVDTVNSVISTENIGEMESLLREQVESKQLEDKGKKIIKSIIKDRFNNLS